MLDYVAQRREAAVVIEAAFRVCPESLERSGSITLVWGALGLKVVDTDFLGRVHVPSWLSVDRWHVTGRTLCRTFEHSLTSCGSGGIKAAGRRRRRGDCELKELKRRKFRGDQIRITAHVTKTCTRCNRKLHWIIQARIVERTLPVHLEVCDERVPMRHRSPAGPGMKIHACKTESRRQESCRGFAVRTESLAVEKQLRIELARSPALQNRSHCRFTHAQQFCDWLKIRTQRRDRADVEIAIGPTIKTLADTGRE